MSKASSVMLKSVMRTGMMRVAFHTKTASGDCIGMISMRAESVSASLTIRSMLDGIDQHLQRRELRLDADGERQRILGRRGQLVGGVDLGVDA